MSEMTLQGQYFDGERPVAIAATLLISGLILTLSGENLSRNYSMGQISVSPRIGSADRFISLPGGGQFQCPDQNYLNNLPQESRSEGPVAWLEARIGIAVASVALIAVFLAVAYFYGLPALAERVIKRIPLESESSLGDEALSWLDSHGWLKHTWIKKDREELIRRDFEKLYRGLPLARYYQLEFRRSDYLGANAIALPGGTIILTDGMVNAAYSENEIMAVLAHEIGHVELRHTLRHLIQDSAVLALAATITGDAASVSTTVSGFPVLLAQTKYSRKFEGEADEFAFKLLRKKGIPPGAFADIMERLSQNEKDERAFAFISTHPVTADRIRRARQAK